MTLMGCGSSPSSGAPVATSAKPESELVFLGSGGQIAVDLQKVLNEWGAQNGVKVTYVTGSAEQGRAQLEAQQKAGNVQYDVLVGNDQTVAIGRAQGDWEKLDLKLLTNTSQVLPDYAFPKDIMGSPAFGVRFLLVPVGIAYNTQIFAKNGWAPPSSWHDLYDPKYAKCSIPLSPASGVNYLPWLNYLNSKDYANFSVTLSKFKAIRSQVPTFSTSNPTAVNLLAQGVGCMTPSQQGRALQVAATGGPIGFVFPKEGSPYFGGTLVVAKGAPHPTAAHMAVNLLLSTAAQQLLLDSDYYAPVNTNVKTSTVAAAAQVPTATVIKSTLHGIPIATFDHLDDWIRQWNSMAAGN
jgi:putative spermidine/putrescine transport system substrate-binding protein